MYLKALEIHGFKSFPDKTILPFDHDITAVVGPNGSGKSNISDAIRWVVGEQSTRMLRGGKMEDVIFGGTEKRKQTGYAQVSLIMDNSQNIFPLEENEVMVTRKYYRSGESEYFINKHAVRLKDVNELFMDTGLGKEGYALIGQGKIDEILSVKSGQRREVFEEAAGISRFRHRKEESTRKLERTQDNLVRIQDKISELELQVKPLQAQSETAKKFLILRDELRSLEISLWLEQISQVQASKRKLSGDYQEALREKDQVSAAVDALYARVEALSEEMRDKDGQGEQLRRTLQSAQNGVTEQEATITVLKNKISNNESNAKMLAESLSQKQQRQETLRQQIQQQEEVLTKVKETRSTLTQDHAASAQKAETLQQQLQQLSAQLKDLQQREGSQGQDASDAKAKLSALASSSQEIFDQDEVLRQELAGLEARITQEQEHLAQEQKNLKEAQEGKLSAQNSLAGYQLRLEGQLKKLDSQKKDQEAQRMNLHSMESKMKLLTDMERSFEGFYPGVKAVMAEAARGGLQNIHGPVAGLISVPKDFTVAIETALGGAMQNIVVDTPREAKAISQYLKRREGGKVTVLPLSNMRGSALSQKQTLAQEPGFVGIASDLISFDPRFAPAFLNLLGRVVIMENWDTADAVAQKYQHQFRLVTLDGQVFNRGGTMTVGTDNKKRTSTIFSRKEELEQLKGRFGQEQSALDSINKAIQEASAQISGDQYQLEVAQGELRTWEDSILQCQAQVESIGRGVEERTAQLAGRQFQLVQLKDRSEKIQVTTQEIQDKISQYQESVTSLQEEIQEQTQAHSQMQQDWLQENQQASQLSAQLDGLVHEEDTAQQALTNLQGFLDDVAGEQSQSNSRIQDYSLENQGYFAEIQRKEQEILASQEQVTTLSQEVAQLTAQRLSLEEQRNKSDKESREKNNDLLSMEREVGNLQQKMELATQEEAQILEKLWSNYELSHQGALEQKIELESIPKATRKIGELKRDISALGNINIDAIEEFDRINERYTYLTDQQNDIIGAKKDLEQIIADIVKEMEQIFSEEFEKINAAFGEIFVQLFGGGQAKVVLEDPSDVLGTGIEIHAQPPGKALKVISLLSGGEKAFVAIALYFAILRIRPTPFVVMDEIEAALDDSNIERFVDYVKQISDKTQFIIITHRRGTMEAADVLYGITMQERGVSRMLRLDINDVEKELDLNLA